MPSAVQIYFSFDTVGPLVRRRHVLLGLPTPAAASVADEVDNDGIVVAPRHSPARDEDVEQLAAGPGSCLGRAASPSHDGASTRRPWLGGSSHDDGNDDKASRDPSSVG